MQRSNDRARGENQSSNSSDFWTEERVDKLKAMIAAGNLSGAAMGRELGCTRNSAISKAHRLGIAIGLSPRAAQRQRLQAKSQSQSRDQPPRHAKGAADYVAHSRSEPIEPDLDVPITARVQLIDLVSTSCRWPMGDPQSRDFGFCPGFHTPGSPYCDFHAKRAAPKGSAPSRSPKPWIDNNVISRKASDDEARDLVDSFENL